METLILLFSRVPRRVLAGIIAAIAILTTLFVLWHRYETEKQATARAMQATVIAENNVRALRDTVRTFVAHDTAATAAVRLAEQRQLTVDSLRGALRIAFAQQRVAARVGTMITTRTIVDSVLVHAPVTDGVRVAHESVSTDAITGSIHVRAPLDTTEPLRVGYQLTTNPMALTVGIACSKSGAPSIAVETPPWAHATVAAPVVSPDVCNRMLPPATGTRVPIRWAVLLATATLFAGLRIAHH